MPVNAISGNGAIAPLAESRTAKHSTSFGDTLAKVLGELDNMQAAVDTATHDLVSGNVDDFHQVVILSEKATLSLQLAVQVRNKVLEAYHEVMRTQV